MFVDDLWSHTGKGLTSWLSFVMLFPIGILVQYGALLYRFLIFALFLTFIYLKKMKGASKLMSVKIHYIPVCVYDHSR